MNYYKVPNTWLIEECEAIRRISSYTSTPMFWNGGGSDLSLIGPRYRKRNSQKETLDNGSGLTSDMRDPRWPIPTWSRFYRWVKSANERSMCDQWKIQAPQSVLTAPAQAHQVSYVDVFVYWMKRGSWAEAYTTDAIPLSVRVSHPSPPTGDIIETKIGSEKAHPDKSSKEDLFKLLLTSVNLR